MCQQLICAAAWMLDGRGVRTLCGVGTPCLLQKAIFCPSRLIWLFQQVHCNLGPGKNESKQRTTGKEEE